MVRVENIEIAIVVEQRRRLPDFSAVLKVVPLMGARQIHGLPASIGKISRVTRMNPERTERRGNRCRSWAAGLVIRYGGGDSIRFTALCDERHPPDDHRPQP
jgi:hypothetical protein